MVSLTAAVSLLVLMRLSARALTIKLKMEQSFQDMYYGGNPRMISTQRFNAKPFPVFTHRQADTGNHK